MQRLFLRHHIALLLIAATVMIPMESQADAEIEIKHLIEYIENSRCTFIRNGKKYNTKETLVHIHNKYEYTKRWINKKQYVRPALYSTVRWTGIFKC
jgi:hypothetical protein